MTAILLIETSGRIGKVGLARGEAVVRSAELDSARRHARDLAAAISSLLGDEGLRPADLTSVMVSMGPGSYTGLRVGSMTAKTLAYALGCELIPVGSFTAVAEQAPADASVLDVIADALQGMLYVQRFQRDSLGVWQSVSSLRIEASTAWLAGLTESVWVSGPGVKLVEGKLAEGVALVPEGDREPRIAGLFRAGLRISAVSRDEMLRLEPLYLRGSSAEEKAKVRQA